MRGNFRKEGKETGREDQYFEMEERKVSGPQQFVGPHRMTRGEK